MALGTMEYFKVILMVMIFYSFSITIISYNIPEDSLNHLTSFSDLSTEIGLESISEEIQGSIQEQSDIPVIELGALVFYSGNILLDLLLNFAFAIPQMFGLLVHGLTSMIGVNPEIANTATIFASVMIMVMYFVSLMQLVQSIRSGRVV